MRLFHEEATCLRYFIDICETYACEPMALDTNCWLKLDIRKGL